MLDLNVIQQQIVCNEYRVTYSGRQAALAVFENLISSFVRKMAKSLISFFALYCGCIMISRTVTSLKSITYRKVFISCRP